MDEIVRLIVERTGVSEQVARSAADVVINFLKQKLPAPIAGQLDSVLDNPDLGSQAGDLLSGLGGMFGKK